MSRRLVRFGGRPDLVPVGSSGASIAHWVSVRSCRPVTGGDHEVSGGLVFFVEVPVTGDLATFRSTRHHNSLDRRIRRLLKHGLAPSRGPGGGDGAAAEDEVAVVEDAGLAGGDGVDRLVQVEPDAGGTVGTFKGDDLAGGLGAVSAE